MDDARQQLQTELCLALKCLDVSLTDVAHKEDIEAKEKEMEALKDKLGLDMSAMKCDRDKLAVENESLSKKLSEHDGCQDKIVALRNVARALECENELLLAEKDNAERSLGRFRGLTKTNDALRVAVDQIDALRRELMAKDQERSGFMAQFEHQEAEKVNVVRQLAKTEGKLDSTLQERNSFKAQLSDTRDTLGALRESKKLVEFKLQAALEENQRLMYTSERLAEAESNVEALQSELAVQASLYESRISGMQAELDKRLDEITSSKDIDVQGVKRHYADMFHEKAQELQQLRQEQDDSLKELSETKRRLKDFEYREEELHTMLARKQACHDDELQKTTQEVMDKMADVQSHASRVEQELDLVRQRYLSLQSSYVATVQKFKAATVAHEDTEVPAVNDSSSTTEPHSQTTNVTSDRPTSRRKRARRKRR